MPVVIQDFNPPPCEECGAGAVHHGLERFSLRLERWMRIVTKPMEKLARPFEPSFNRAINRIAPYAASFIFQTGLAVKIEKPDKYSCETSRALWNEARRRGIEMYEIRPLGLPRKQFIGRYRGESVAFYGIPRPARRQKSLSWVDDKAQVKRRFQEAGFPVPRGGSASTEQKAIELFRLLRKPAVVKPREGSGGRHTTVHIETEARLMEAYRNARLVAPSVIVEEEIAGPVFRATLIGKKLSAVLRRDPPTVIGNGRSSVRNLAAAENENPLRRGPVFAPIDINSSAAEKEMKLQKISEDDVPALGAEIRLHFKVNWGVGGTSRDATGETHPDNKKLFEDIGEYLGEDIVGIDFMTNDIGLSWRDTRCGIIELNSLPLIGNHHFPYTGPARNVAGEIWEMIFPESSANL